MRLQRRLPFTTDCPTTFAEATSQTAHLQRLFAEAQQMVDTALDTKDEP